MTTISKRYMKNIKVTNIVWDTDGEDVDLPTSLEIKVPKNLDVENELSDLITQKYGWLISSLNYREVSS
jgi:hypothetical protein